MGTRQRRDRETRQRRQSILSAARKLFWKHGYTGTTMPQVADAAELAPGTLYLYFPSKDALYVELLTEGYDLLQQQLQAVANEKASALEKASRMIDAFFKFAEDCPEYFNIIFFVIQKERSGGFEGTFQAEQVQRLREREAACKAIASEVLGRAGGGAHSGDIAVIEAVWGMLAGLIFYFGNDRSFAEVADKARGLILRGVFGAGSEKQP